MNAFSRVAPYLNHEKGKIFCNTFLMSNFNYYPLNWMYHGKTSSNQVDRVQKKALRILHNDCNMQFEVLLKRTDERRVHTKNLQNLMLQIFKCLSEQNPSFMWTFFERKYLTYKLRNKNLLQLPKRSANKFGANSLVFKGALLWNTLPDTIKTQTQHDI